MSREPLRGVRVVITRAVHQASSLVTAFADAGAEVVCLPLLEVVREAGPPLDRAIAEAGSWRVWVFTSSNAVETFVPQLRGGVRPALLAAVGPATAKSLRQHGYEPHLVARKSRGEGLLEELLPHLDPRRDGLLVPQASDARPELVAGLKRGGFRVKAVTAYRKRLPEAAEEEARRLFAEGPLGWVTFTSPRIVRHFKELLGADWSHRRGELRAISIGPVTSRALRDDGVEPAAEAEHPEPAALVAAVVAVVVAAMDRRLDSAL